MKTGTHKRMVDVTRQETTSGIVDQIPSLLVHSLLEMRGLRVRRKTLNFVDGENELIILLFMAGAVASHPDLMSLGGKKACQ